MNVYIVKMKFRANVWALGANIDRQTAFRRLAEIEFAIELATEKSDERVDAILNQLEVFMK